MVLLVTTSEVIGIFYFFYFLLMLPLFITTRAHYTARITDITDSMALCKAVTYC